MHIASCSGKACETSSKSDESHVLSDVPARSVARKSAVFGVRGSEFGLSSTASPLALIIFALKDEVFHIFRLTVGNWVFEVVQAVSKSDDKGDPAIESRVLGQVQGLCTEYPIYAPA